MRKVIFMKFFHEDLNKGVTLLQDMLSEPCRGGQEVFGSGRKC